MAKNKVSIIKEDESNGKAWKINSYIDDYFGLIILACVLVVFIGTFAFVWYPRLLLAQSTVSNITQQLNDESEQLDKYEEAMTSYQEKFSQVSENDKIRIDNMIAPEFKYPAIYYTDLTVTFADLLTAEGFNFASIEAVGLADVNNSKIKKKTASATSDTEALPEGTMAYKVTIEIENINYERLKYLLDLIEKKLRIADVISLDFSPIAGTCTLELHTYGFGNIENK